MNVALWIVQGLLALFFGMVGMTKIVKDKEDIKEAMPWVEDFTSGQVRMTGILEVLAAIGLILPSVTKILPELTGLAGIGLALTMVGAIVVHIRRNELFPPAFINVVLMAMALFVAWGRLVEVPIS